MLNAGDTTTAIASTCFKKRELSWTCMSVLMSEIFHTPLSPIS